MRNGKKRGLKGLCLTALAWAFVFSAAGCAAPQGSPAPAPDAGASQTVPAQEPSAGTAAPAPAAPAEGEIGEAEAKSAALAHAGLTEGEVTFTESRLDREDGRRVYELEFYTADGTEYEYEIDAAGGTVLKADYDGGPVTPPETAYLDEAQARQIALDQVPGASASHLCKWELDREDCAYEGEIVYDGYEYDFKLNARTGEVLEWEWEHCDDGGHHSDWHHG